MNISPERMSRIQKAIRDGGLDALLVRLSEHVLYFTGYWPRNGACAAVIPAEGRPVLVIGEMEEKLELVKTPPSKGVEIVTYPLESATVMRGPNDGFAAMLPGIFQKLGLEGGKVGLEQSVEQVNTSVFHGEVKVPAAPTWAMLKKALPGVQFEDGSGVILGLRVTKAPEEVEAIRLATEIAGFGLAAAREALRPGMKETELAAVIESAIHVQGTGYRGVNQARGYACVYSGPRSATQWVHYAYSTERVIENDEIVIIELGAFADGYWTDLTRNLCAGTPSARAQEMFAATLEAQRAAIDLARPGVHLSDLVQASNAALARCGLAEYITHGLGHGVGMAYHEGPPVHIQSHRPIEAGMVLTVEPGVYIDPVGGIRPEDVIVVYEGGAEVLSAGILHRL